MHFKIIAAQNAVTVAQGRLAQVVADVQATCSHKHVGECNHKMFEGGGALPPMRVCLDCGISEDGWGIGYVVLDNQRVLEMSREEIYKVRAGKFFGEEAKCAEWRNRLQQAA